MKCARDALTQTPVKFCLCFDRSAEKGSENKPRAWTGNHECNGESLFGAFAAVNV